MTGATAVANLISRSGSLLKAVDVSANLISSVGMAHQNLFLWVDRFPSGAKRLFEALETNIILQGLSVGNEPEGWKHLSSQTQNTIDDDAGTHPIFAEFGSLRGHVSTSKHDQEHGHDLKTLRPSSLLTPLCLGLSLVEALSHNQNLQFINLNGLKFTDVTAQLIGNKIGHFNIEVLVLNKNQITGKKQTAI